MARPVHKHERNSIPKSKSSKARTSHAHSRGAGHKGSTSVQTVQRPIRPSNNAPKIKQTVSAAGIFKHAKAKAATQQKKQRKQRSPSPDETSKIDLSEYFHEGIEEAREAIDAKVHLGFIKVHQALTHKLAESRANDDAFFKKMASVATIFSMPLGEEEVDTTSMRNGKPVTERVKIGDRVAVFKSGIEKESARLREAWKKWEELTKEFADFAVGVLGPEAFGRRAVDEDEEREEEGKKGFKWEMELLKLEFGEAVGELTEEIEELKSKTLSKTKTAEQALASASKREYQQVLHLILTE